jgi:hypothetical protein
MIETEVHAEDGDSGEGSAHRSHRRSISRRRRNAIFLYGGAILFLLSAVVRPVAAGLTLLIVGVIWYGMRQSTRVVRRRPLAFSALIVGIVLWITIAILQATDVVVDAPVLQSDAYMDWEFTPMKRFVDVQAVYSAFAAGLASTFGLSMAIYGHYGSQKKRMGRRSRHVRQDVQPSPSPKISKREPRGAR